MPKVSCVALDFARGMIQDIQNGIATHFGKSSLTRKKTFDCEGHYMEPDTAHGLKSGTHGCT